MPKPIIWSPLAESDFSSILDYLQIKWGNKVVTDFISITESAVFQIAVNPKQFPVINKQKQFGNVWSLNTTPYFIASGKSTLTY